MTGLLSYSVLATRLGVRFLRPSVSLHCGTLPLSRGCDLPIAIECELSLQDLFGVSATNKQLVVHGYSCFELKGAQVSRDGHE